MGLAFVVTAAGAVTAEKRAAMSHAGHEVPAAHDLTEHKGLDEGALTFFGTLMIGLASVAPAYSLAVTLGYVVIEDGTLAPVAVVLGFIPMLLTAFAYRELNKVIPDCGTTFTWVTKAFGPKTGWFGGWVLTIAGIIVLTSLAQVAAQYTFLLLGADSLADNTFWVTVLGVVFIAVMAWVSYRGIVIAEWLQNVLVGIQYLALGVLVVVALIAVAGPNRAGHGNPDRGFLVQSIGLLRRGRWRVLGADRGHAADGLHLLGLGHDPVCERGDEGTGEDPRTRSCRRDAHPGGDVHAHHRGGDLVRRGRDRRHRAGQRGQRRRRVPRDQRAGARRLELDRASGRPGVGGRVHPDDDPPGGTRHARYGCLPGAPDPVREDPSQVQDADRLDSVHRWRRHRAVRAAQSSGGERVRRRAGSPSVCRSRSTTG